MAMITNLKGRLRNTTLPKTHGLLPVYEAIVNSIHSIEERGLPPENGKITVEIIRSQQGNLELDKGTKKRGPEAGNEIEGFRIIDNGIGFNIDNMQSFETLDSEHKIEQGCRGVGRLLWLKAFDRVSILSTYDENDGVRYTRSFQFDKNLGISDERSPTEDNGSEIRTVVHLDGFKLDYKEYSRKTVSSIANLILEHCLWYFIRTGGAPNIIIIDGMESIDLMDTYDEHMVTSSDVEEIEIKKQNFNITHIKLRSNTSQSHTFSYCANNRVVKEESINGKVPGLYGRIIDGENEFVYTCYISSKYLDDHVRSERIDFNFEEQSDGLFHDEEISLNEIRGAVLLSTKSYLEKYLEANRKAGKARVEEFVSQVSPKYRPILSHLSEDDLSVDPDISDKELDLNLHKKLTEIESKLLSQGHDIMAPKKGEDPKVYQERIQTYLDTVSDIKKSDLASYVSHRRVIIDLMEKAIEKKDTGKFQREDIIHQLIMPMGQTTDDLLFDSANLWLIDERLAFHDYLASDIALKSMPITGSESGKEPDLLALNVFDNPVLVSEGISVPLASIVVIEIKRPMRDDARQGEEKDPIEQALGYLERVREGRVQTSAGRPIPASESIPGYCYILCDLTPTIIKRCKVHDAILTSDGLGYFFYNKAYKAYVEVISFDRLVNMAKQRNRAFFDKLGLPSK